MLGHCPDMQVTQYVRCDSTRCEEACDTGGGVFCSKVQANAATDVTTHNGFE